MSQHTVEEQRLADRMSAILAAKPTLWADVTGKPPVFPPESHAHALADLPAALITDTELASELIDYVDQSDPRLSDARTPLAHAHSAYETHILSAHAPANAQKNSDITKGEIEAKLTGQVTSHTHPPSGGSDPWTVLKLASNFTTSLIAAVDVPGLSFAPAANTSYMIEALLLLRTAAAAVNPRVGFAWPTGMSDGVMSIDEAQTATTQIMARGNIGAALLSAVGGLPNATQSWPAYLFGAAIAGAAPVGNLRVQLASETAGTVVTVMAGSFLRYRSY